MTPLLKTGFLIAGLALPSIASPSDAAAQTGLFRCPRAGTVAIIANHSIIEAIGPDRADPEACRMVNTIFREHRLLFNFWPMPIQGDDAPVRTAMRALVSGQVKEVTFNITRNVRGADGRLTGDWLKTTQTLRVLGTETVTIGGKPLNTTIIEQIENYQGRTDTRRYNMDNATGVFVKMTEAVRAGRVVLQDFELTSLTAPPVPPHP